MNSKPSSSASMNSQLAIDMLECAREYPEYVAGDHGFETAELCIMMNNLTLLEWCLGYWGVAHCLGVFRERVFSGIILPFDHHSPLYASS